MADKHTARENPTFPIVAIGASAGGLEPLRQLLSRLPADTGMAFIVIQHLDPDRPSLLASVLASDVQMPVVEVADGMRAKPNRVYVIPASADLSIHAGLLTLVPRQRRGKRHLPIDLFFRALAADFGARAMGVVLSGSGSDGTEGLRAIKAANGITLVQTPESAQFRSMPDSAIAAGVVDFQGTPEAIAEEVVGLSRQSYLATSNDLEQSPEQAGPDDETDDETSLALVLAAIRRHAHFDFRGYKRPTMMRRIARRMALRRLESLSEYADSLSDDPDEAEALARDILIHVTSFFRDPGAFEALAQHALPELLARKDDFATLRVWVPGCSTGEEVYSLAICLVEYLSETRQKLAIKIFGSDLSERAIEAARAGAYSESDVEGVSPQRLTRFFDRAEGRYRVGKTIRELCVFVRHDLTRDPPFAKLDIISCRNVLIYFDADLQRRILPLLHHCLNPAGTLLLGSSEGIRDFNELFVPIDNDQRIFRKTGESPRIVYPPALAREAESKLRANQPTQRPLPVRNAQRQADHILLARYAPPGVVVNEALEVIQFRGQTGDFFEPPPGQPETNVLKLARAGLVSELREALALAMNDSIAVRRQGVRIAVGSQERSINLEVVPLAGITTPTERNFLILFEDPATRERAADRSPPGSATGDQLREEVARLRAELAVASDYLQAITGEHHDTAEELGATNEELIAANEELQSTNEELQSAQEELQSTNEELTTLNDQLLDRNQQLDLVASDLANVLESVQIPVIMVDQALRVRRFTPTARQISSLLPADVGRSIDDVKIKLKLNDLAQDVREAIDSITPTECEVQGFDGRWFRLHIRPYRTTEGRYDGAVLSFLDVDTLKRAVQEAERVRDYAQGIVETVPMALIVIDKSLRIESANSPFYRNLATQADAVEHALLFEIAAGALDVPALREAIERGLTASSSFRNVEIQCSLPVSGKRILVISGCPIQGADDEPMLLLAIEDITERRLLEASEKQARLEAEHANRAKDLFLATLSHELRTPLNTILMSAQLLQMTPSTDPRVQRASSAIARAVGNQTKLIDDLLDISRIVSGKLILDLQAVDLESVVHSAVDVARLSAEANGLELEVSVSGALRPAHGDPDRLRQVVANLLDNAIKFTPPGGKIIVSLEAVDEKAELKVKDTGLGLHPEIVPHLFDRFVQAESAMTRRHGGLGLGLAIVHHIVKVHGGEIRAESAGDGKGSEFTVTLPLTAAGATSVTAVKRTVTRTIFDVRVLLIEDDNDTREVCATMLEEHGAEVRATHSVAAGLAALETFVPQVILCDIAMPGEDGYTFIHALRGGDHGSQDTPAAALTALASKEHRKQALESGFQMHLAKPISSEELATAVATLAQWPKLPLVS